MEQATLLTSTYVPRRSFFARPTVELAQNLLGTVLLHRTPRELLAARIVETEAYLGEHDLAAHSHAGRTPRTRVIFGAPGHAYVFTIYGMHRCLNVVAEPDGTPGCVLIRALEPLCGVAAMRVNRLGVERLADLANGPGKLTSAMAIGMQQNGADLLAGPLTIRRFQHQRPITIQATPRVGISKSRDLILRFLIADNECVSHR